MIIIAAKNTFLKQRTGVEEYSFQLLKHIAKKEKKEQVVIYTNKIKEKIDLPSNFHLKVIRLPFLWTQVGLSWKILKLRVMNYRSRTTLTLFIPAHVMPVIHPKRTIVTIHGLEYEHFPEYYSWFSRRYLRWSTYYATKHAWKIISVSKNTKQDLIKLYRADPNKIKVIYHGVTINQKSNSPIKVLCKTKVLQIKNQNDNQKITNKKYFLYLGRIELKKNVLGIIKAFAIFKKNYEDRGQKPYAISYKLILAGGVGYGWKIIKHGTCNLKHKKDIIFMGYVDEKTKWQLLKNAEVLVFPSFYEGFGMPILEAQSVGTPVITSKGSSMEEITDKTALLVDPNKPEKIVEAMYKIINDKKLRKNLIEQGHKNVKKFSWQKCAERTTKILYS